MPSLSPLSPTRAKKPDFCGSKWLSQLTMGPAALGSWFGWYLGCRMGPIEEESPSRHSGWPQPHYWTNLNRDIQSASPPGCFWMRKLKSSPHISISMDRDLGMYLGSSLAVFHNTLTSVKGRCSLLAKGCGRQHRFFTCLDVQFL